MVGINLTRKLLTAGLIFVLFVAVGGVLAAEPVTYALCDVRIVYVYDDPNDIDWPTLFYLNEEYGCQVDLVTVEERASFSHAMSSIEGRYMYLHRFGASADDSLSMVRVLRELFEERRADIVILGRSRGSAVLDSFTDLISAMPSAEGRLFDILKIYDQREHGGTDRGSRNSVVLNGREYYGRYRQRIESEVPRLLPWLDLSANKPSQLVRYELVKWNIPAQRLDNNFLAGIESLRLVQFIDSVLPDGPIKVTIRQQAKKFISYFNASRISVGSTRANFVVDGYRELLRLREHTRVLQTYPDLAAYFERLRVRGERAALWAVGLNWSGNVVVRDSPHGPKVKFIASMSANGPKEVAINRVNFYPFWDTAAVLLDPETHVVSPHQTFVREYLVDVDPSYLKGEKSDSLVFTVEIAYGQIPLVFSSALPVWQAPDLNIRFVPDFVFVRPLPELDVDRVVSELRLKVIITKPYEFSGSVALNLNTPRGMFAGAYRQTVDLERGVLTKIVDIPFTLSNLFELGIQQHDAAIMLDGKLVSSDTGRIRIAECKIPDTRTVGFLPDTSGLLEDILSMTDAAHRPLTDRSLVTADLSAYDVIVIGSGAYRSYPGFDHLKGRFQQYVREGGTLVIFGQPEDWPGVVLPVSFVPSREIVSADEISNLIPAANVLSRPYPVSDRSLLSSFFRKQEVSAAVISPAERVYVTSSGAALLSVSRLGTGEIIFCGLPLLEMVARLDIEAIHLFANILNY